MAEVTVTIHHGKGEKQVINHKGVETHEDLDELYDMVAAALDLEDECYDIMCIQRGSHR
jgi:hypothetical protein